MKLQLDLNSFDACPQYNDWLDEQYVNESGTLKILGYQPRPSYVIFALSQDTYQASFADFQQEREEELKRSVFERFPSPIAYYFGSSDFAVGENLGNLSYSSHESVEIQAFSSSGTGYKSSPPQ